MSLLGFMFFVGSCIYHGGFCELFRPLSILEMKLTIAFVLICGFKFYFTQKLTKDHGFMEDEE
jgi:hypothetical protein